MILDVIISIIVLSLFMGVLFNTTQINIEQDLHMNHLQNISYFHESVYQELYEDLKTASIDREKQGYQKLLKKDFLDNLGGNPVVNAQMNCYNFIFEENTMKLGMRFDNNKDIFVDYKKHLQNGKESLNGEYVSFACMSNTFKNLDELTNVPGDISPINFIIVTYYEGLNLRYMSKDSKFIFYFN